MCRRLSGAGDAPPGHAVGVEPQPLRSTAERLMRKITLKNTRRRLSGSVFLLFFLLNFGSPVASTIVLRNDRDLCLSSLLKKNLRKALKGDPGKKSR